MNKLLLIALTIILIGCKNNNQEFTSSYDFGADNYSDNGSSYNKSSSSINSYSSNSSNSEINSQTISSPEISSSDNSDTSSGYSY